MATRKRPVAATEPVAYTADEVRAAVEKLFPDTPVTVTVHEPQISMPIPAPTFVADAGARIAFDRAGKPFTQGLTDGADSLAAVSAHALSLKTE